MSERFTSRPPGRSAPIGLRTAVERRLGHTVAAAGEVHGGMSPGPAAVLSLANGHDVFVKAVSRTANAGSHQLYQQEAAALAALPSDVPAARLIETVETGHWIAIITELAPGQVAGPPWTNASIHAVAQACAMVAACPAPKEIPPVLQRLPDLDGWTKLAAGDPGQLTPWETRHVEQLAAATTGWRIWTSGKWQTHLDIRADNAVVDPSDSTALLVDWGYCSAAAPWLDRALLAADVVAAGHADGAEIARRMALSLLADQPPEASRFVIAQAGMWRRNSTLSSHPGMPTHRAWQRARADALPRLLTDLLARLAVA